MDVQEQGPRHHVCRCQSRYVSPSLCANSHHPAASARLALTLLSSHSSPPPGLLLLWDVDGGLTRIDPFIESDNEFIKAGALLAIGMVNSTVRNEHEPALALLQGTTRCWLAMRNRSFALWHSVHAQSLSTARRQGPGLLRPLRPFA